jgi:hypothetical protein
MAMDIGAWPGWYRHSPMEYGCAPLPWRPVSPYQRAVEGHGTVDDLTVSLRAPSSGRASRQLGMWQGTPPAPGRVAMSIHPDGRSLCLVDMCHAWRLWCPLYCGPLAKSSRKIGPAGSPGRSYPAPGLSPASRLPDCPGGNCILPTNDNMGTQLPRTPSAIIIRLISCCHRTTWAKKHIAQKMCTNSNGLPDLLVYLQEMNNNLNWCFGVHASVVFLQKIYIFQTKCKRDLTYRKLSNIETGGGQGTPS